MKFMLFVGLTILFATSGATAKKRRASCAEVRRAFASERIGPLKIVPFYAIKPKNLNVCSNKLPTCCTRKMEKRYERKASMNITGTLEARISSLKSHLTNFHHNFLNDFDDLLQVSKAAFLTKLNSTVININLFNMIDDDVRSLFDNITIATDDETMQIVYNNLESPLRRYVSLLFASTFARQTDIDPDNKQISCLLKQVKNISYHESIVNFMLEKITSSLNESATLLKGINLGIDSLEVSTRMLVNTNCHHGLVRMQYCSHCYGLTLIKPCKMFCKNVLNGCLVGFSEVNRFWDYYVTALNDVLTKLTTSHNDPWSVLSTFTGQSDMLEKLAIEEKDVMQIQKTCFSISNKHKRSVGNTFPLSDVKLTPSHRRRRQHRRNRKSSSDLSSPTTSKEPVNARRLIPPPHKMLIWEPSISSKHQKHKKKSLESNREVLFDLKPEEADSQPEEGRSRYKSKFKRFMRKLSKTRSFFDDLPSNICNLYDDSSFGITFRNCWDGRNIVDNYTTPVYGKSFSDQLSNSEVRVSGVHKSVFDMIGKLQHAAKFLALHADKTLPQELSIPPSEVIKITQSEAPCDDDEDSCSHIASGDGANEFDSTHERDIKNHKKTQSALKKGKGRKRKRPKQNLKDQSEIGFDIKLLLKNDKGFSSLSQGGAKNVDKKKNKNDPDNSSTSVYNFTTISRTILFQLFILLTTHYVLS